MSNKRAGVEIFKGFNFKYPEYEVITPQGMKSYTLRSMKVSDEQNLKGSMITPSKIARHLAECIWDCLVKKPDDIKTFDDFISKTTMKDRDALLFGLYVATYKDVQGYTITCDECGFTNKVKIDVSKWFTAKTWLERDNGDQKFTPVLDYRPEARLDIFNSVRFLLKSPTIKDEIQVAESNAFASEEMSQLKMTLSMVDCVKIDPSKEQPEGETYSEMDNIVAIYNSIPAPDRKIIEKKYDEEFGQYQINVKGKLRCTKCQKEKDVTIDITSQFFRALYE